MALDAFVVLGVADAVMAWVLAGFVVLAGRSRTVNRLLGVLLALEGSAQFGLALETAGLGHSVGEIVGGTALLALPLLYPLFLAYLDTPLVRPFRHRIVRAFLLTMTVGIEALWLIALAHRNCHP